MGNILTIALTYDYWRRNNKKKRRGQSGLENQIKERRAIMQLFKKRESQPKYKDV